MIHPKMSNEVESISPVVGPEAGAGGGGGRARAEDVDSDVRDAPSHSSSGSVVGRDGTSIYDIHSRMYVSGLPVLHGTSIPSLRILFM